MARSVLVTGTSGFVGGHVVRTLVEEGAHVVSVGRTAPTSPGAVSHAVAHFPWDLERDRALPDRLPPVDAVIHLAFPLKPRLDDEGIATQAATVGATGLLLDHCRRTGAQFTLISSGDVLRPGLGPIDEASAVIAPESAYGALKASAELLTLAYASSVACATVRLFHPYGAGGDAFLVNRALLAVRAGEALFVDGDAGFRITPVWVTDAARVISAIATTRAEGVFHVAGPETFTLRALFEACGFAAGRTAKIVSRPEASPRENHAGTSTRVEPAVGFRPMTLFAEGARCLLGANP